MAQSYVALMARAISNPPKFSEIQQMIRDDFMPAVDNASRYMDKFWMIPISYSGDPGDDGRNVGFD